MTAIDFANLFQEVEQAIDEHPSLMLTCESCTRISIDRYACRVSIQVRLRQSRRRRPTLISAFGDTPQEAAHRLIAQLDIWAEAIR